MTVVDAPYESLEHLLRHFKVINRAVAYWPVHFSVERRAPEHLVGFSPDGQNFSCVLVNGDRRRLVQYDAPARSEYQRVHRAQINRQIVREKIPQNVHVDKTPETLLPNFAGIQFDSPLRFGNSHASLTQRKSQQPRSLLEQSQSRSCTHAPRSEEHT